MNEPDEPRLKASEMPHLQAMFSREELEEMDKEDEEIEARVAKEAAEEEIIQTLTSLAMYDAMTPERWAKLLETAGISPEDVANDKEAD